MSLATRCTVCNTVFRVTQDHLNVSAGWVRCGRCQQEFNGLDQLFDLEADDTPALTFERDGLADIGPPVPDVDIRAQDNYTVASDATDLDGLPGQEPDEPDNARPFDAALEVPDDFESQPNVLPDELPLAASDEDIASSPTFIRQDDDNSLSKRPGARLAFALLVLLLSMALLLQGAFHFRDTLAARLPQTRSVLMALCKLAECRVRAPRRIDDIVVESSALTHEPRGNTFRLLVVLRNRGTLTLAMPSVELTLTDSRSQVLARRTLMPADFNHPAGVLMPAMETSLGLVLAGASKHTTGYTVEAFYP